MIRKLRRLPTIVEGILFTGEKANVDEIGTFCLPRKFEYQTGAEYGRILTPDNSELPMKVKLGGFVLRGETGHCYPCDIDIIERTYKDVTDEESYIPIVRIIR